MFAYRTQGQPGSAQAGKPGPLRPGRSDRSHVQRPSSFPGQRPELRHAGHETQEPPGATPGRVGSATPQPRLGSDFARIAVHAHDRRLESAALAGAELAGPDAIGSPHGPGTRGTVPRKVTRAEHTSQRISVSIPRVGKSDSWRTDARQPASWGSAGTTVFPAAQHDAMPGGEQASPVDFRSFVAQPTASIAEPRPGQTVRLPDIVIPAMAAIEQRDAIASTLSYNPSITQSGPPPSPFGATMPYTHALSGITVTPAARHYNVTATVDNPITFQVAGGGDTDIASEADPNINQGNYAAVASDLAPDMTDLGGRPPRTHFWAQDLCIRHERFHATEDTTYGRSGVTLAQNWLNGQPAASVAQVHTLLGQVPGRVAATVSAAMAYPGREIRAYGDGAPLYQARATAIKTKGDARGYASGGLSRGAKTGIGVGGGALAGAGIGALAGGPIGAAIGAGIGALAGGIGSLFF